jgi:hypothetical protein
MSMTAGILELFILSISPTPTHGTKLDTHVQEDHECLVVDGILHSDHRGSYGWR